MKMDSESTFSEVHRLKFPDPDNPFANLLVEELAASGDGLIREAARANWEEGEVLYYLRMRSIKQDGGAAGYLAEITFLNLTPPQAEGFIQRYRSLREQQVSRFSMYAVLEQCGLADLRAGRTQVSLGRPTGFVAHQQWLPYQPMIIAHIISGALWLLLIPWTRLVHMIWFAFTRAYMGSEFGAVRHSRDW